MSGRQQTTIKQEAKQEATIRVSMQQVLDSQLLELGDDDLLMRIDNEINENSALEEGREDSDENEFSVEDEDYDEQGFTDDDINYNVDSEELPVYTSNSGDSQSEIPIGETKSFIDELNEQLAEQEMEDEKQRALVEYLIASLDDNGFVDRPLASIADDLLFHHNIEVTEEELNRALKVLQRLDPPGIGARNLRECMLIQLDRKIDEYEEEGNGDRVEVLKKAKLIVEKHFDLFKRNERSQLAQILNLDPQIFNVVFAELTRLNPRPGLALSESSEGKAQAVVPDFIIETNVDGNISFTLQGGKIPPLRVNKAYQEMIDHADNAKLSDSKKDDLKYIKNNVERAQGFINAIRKRQETLTKTMRAIIEAQRPFMLSQDDADLKPLTGGEIAKRIGMDGSTVSRAVSNRYALLDGTLYSLKDFFLRTKRNAGGEEVLRTQIEAALTEIIENEDKSNPLNDTEIAEEMKKKGLNIQRRTVAKYRSQLQIPSANMRKQF